MKMFMLGLVLGLSITAANAIEASLSKVSIYGLYFASAVNGLVGHYGITNSGLGDERSTINWIVKKGKQIADRMAD